jgi:hypothetical protein
MKQIASRFTSRIVTLSALAIGASLALVATPASATTAPAAQPLNGLFRVAAGSYFRMIYPGGGKYFKNPYSAEANKTYTSIVGGTDGGLRTGVLQPAPTPAFDHHGNSLAGRIIRPTDFAGINFGLATKGTAPVISVSGARLSGQVKGFTAEWNNLSFSQGGQVTGSYNTQTHVYVLTWSSPISGGPFNGFTGSWHLTGTFVS